MEEKLSIPMLNLKKQYYSIKPEIDKVVSEVMESGSFIGGRFVAELEEEAAKYCNVNYAIGVNSGTDALYLSLLALDVTVGDEVITSAFSFIASASIIRLVGARPVFADIDEETFNIDVNEIEKKITRKTKAIIPVHLYGHAVDMDSLLDIAKKKNIAVVEDAAQSIGALYNNKKIGSLGKLSALSFYPTKNLGAFGDGGMILTNDKKLAEKIRKLANHGEAKKYDHEMIGINSRLDGLQAAILKVKLKYLDKWTEKRREHVKLFNKLFEGTSVLTPVEKPYAFHVYNQYTVRCSNRNEIHNKLKEKGISAGVHYPITIPSQRCMKDLGYPKGSFANSEKASDEVLSLPIYPELTESEIRYIAANLLSALEGNKS